MEKIFLILLLIFNCTTPCFGYFYSVELLTNNQHNVFLLSDVHYLDDRDCYPGDPEYEEKKIACNKQRSDLLEIANRLNGYVIVEDLFIRILDNLAQLYSCSQTLNAAYYKDSISFDPNIDCSQNLPDLAALSEDPYNEELSPLSFLSQFCHKFNIPCNNIEFRFYFDCYPVILLMEKYKKILTEIKSYNDGKQLNAVYQNILRDFEQKHIQWDKIFNDVLNEFGQQITVDKMFDNLFSTSESSLTENKFLDLEKKYKAIETLRFHPSKLIDMRILHSIYHSPCKNIFVCAGGNHISRVQETLLSLGYKSKKIDISYITPDGIEETVDLKIFFSQLKI